MLGKPIAAAQRVLTLVITISTAINQVCLTEVKLEQES